MKPDDLTYELCRRFISDQLEVDTMLKNKVLGMCRARNLASLTSCSSHFDQAYHLVGDWRFLRQVEAFFKKNSAFANNERCSQAAQEAFIASEEQCNRTNLRLDYLLSERSLISSDLQLKITKMARYIRNVLGNFQPFLDELPNLVKVTSGATENSARKYSLPQLKMKMRLFATANSHSFIRALYRYYGFNAPKIEEVRTNRVELVPKNWKTSRTIACEPEGNLPLQLAFDTYVKRRLRRFGIDLSNQSCNQEKALIGSVTGEYATLDHKAASDTVAYILIPMLFPWEWYCYLDRIRAPEYRGAFGKGKYAKFSSMGNGSTFTIETLLFAAACYAVGSKRFSVYGDDVIIEPEYVEDYKALTRFLGFSINEDKSFSSGPFRESCGLDAFDGIDVTPFYVRTIRKSKASLCHIVNGLAGICLPGGELESFLINMVIDLKLPLVPYQESTISGVHVDPDLARHRGTLKTKKWVAYSRSYVPESVSKPFVDSRGYYLWFLNKNSQVLFGGPWHLARSIRCDETSSVPLFQHKYVRKWVGWYSPPSGIPVHLHWWTEQVRSRLKAA